MNYTPKTMSSTTAGMAGDGQNSTEFCPIRHPGWGTQRCSSGVLENLRFLTHPRLAAAIAVAPKRFTKKAQVKMTETIAILIIFFILVMFAIIFFSQIQRSTFEQRSTTAAGERAISTALRATFLPELVCTKGDNVELRDCIDITKLEAAAAVIQAHDDYYFDIFQYATVKVVEYYPVERTTVLYSRTRDGKEATEFTAKATTPVPVSLYDPFAREHYFGVLVIDVYT